MVLALGLAAAALACVLGRNPLITTSALGLAGASSIATSILMGLLVAAGTIAMSRVLVRKEPWARALHEELRPAVHRASDGAILTMALTSGIGEELVFRGLLVPIVGIAIASIAFGLLHQLRGPARWAWAGWATVTGFLFATIFALTGSLAGPLVAHVAINFVNLRHLRDHDVSAGVFARAHLGGILANRCERRR